MLVRKSPDIISQALYWHTTEFILWQGHHTADLPKFVVNKNSQGFLKPDFSWLVIFTQLSYKPNAVDLFQLSFILIQSFKNHGIYKKHRA